MKKKMRVGVALAAALTIALTAFAGNEAIAALPIIEPDDGCSITFELPESGFEELTVADIPVSVYQVATVDEAGKFTENAEFSSMATALAAISDQTTAADWADMSEAAYDVICNTEVDSSEKAEDASIIGGLKTGLYLVVPGGKEAGYNDGSDAAEYTYGVVLTDEHVYEFTPYLVALPFNYYNGIYAGDQIENPSDEWVYDMTSVFKAAQYDRYGSIEITKTLQQLNETLDGANFVYDITATKTVKDAETGKDSEKVLLSDVVQLTITADSRGGRESVIIDRIPAGADVTVTEIYTGATYKRVVPADSDSQSEIIIADETVGVEFVNTHDNEIKYGSGAVNTFEKLEDGRYLPTINGVQIGERELPK